MICQPCYLTLFQFIILWRMPIFFIISGFFANLVITRKSLIIWWKNRFLRIVLPIIIFYPIVSLTLPWIFKYGYTGHVNFFFSNEGQPHHLWFLYHLFIFVLFSIFIKFFGLIIYKFFKQINLIVVVDIFNTVKSFLGRHIFDSRFPVLLRFLSTALPEFGVQCCQDLFLKSDSQRRRQAR